MLPEREEPANDGPKKYLRGDEYLMKNPHAKAKKTAKSLKRTGSIKKSKKLGSPKSPKRGARRGGSIGSGDEFGL